MVVPRENIASLSLGMQESQSKPARTEGAEGVVEARINSSHKKSARLNLKL